MEINETIKCIIFLVLYLVLCNYLLISRWKQNQKYFRHLDDILYPVFFGIQKPENITNSYPAEHQYCPYCHFVSAHTSAVSENGGINTQGLHFHWNKHLLFSILHLNKIFLSQVLLLYKSNNSYYSFESILKTGNGNNKYHLS